MELQPKTTEYSAPKEFFAHEHFVAQPGGITIDYSTVVTAEDGSRILEAGAFLGKITASGKYGPYDSGASDGRQTCTGLLMMKMDVTNGDSPAGMMIHGFVKDAALPEQSNATIRGHVPLIKFIL